MKKCKITPSKTHGHGSGGDGTGTSRKRGKYSANLRKRGLLHFQIGLILAMLMVYIGLESSFHVYQERNDELEDIQEAIWEIREDVPSVVKEEPLKRKARPRPSTNFVPVPDDVDLNPPTEVIEPIPDADADTSLDPGDIAFAEEKVAEEIPFTAVEEAPVFPGCETVDKKDRYQCFQEKINNHIRKHVRYPEVEKEMGIGGKVYVTFRISEDGTISNIQLKGPSPGLEKEAERIILELPRMTPGKQRGRPVRVPFSIPIIFKLN